MYTRPDLAEYEKEIDRLGLMADKLDSLGMKGRAKGHKATVMDLRLRLEQLKLVATYLSLKARAK
jgi:hypothetical protein